MAQFDPDAYLAGGSAGAAGFDPDAYLAAAPKPSPAQTKPSKAKPSAEPISGAGKLAFGVMDPVHGGAQLLTNALPSGVVDAGNRLNNWLADNTGLVAKIPVGGVDQMVREREAVYQARRAASGDTGFDFARTAGNILSPANLAVPGGGATSLAGRTVGAGLSGATGAALAPVTDGEFWDGKTSQVATGGAFGAAAPVLGRTVGRIVSPKASQNPALQKLLDEGITPTPGQIAGGALKRGEEALTSVPVAGFFIRAGQQRAADQLNVAVANRALAPIGKTLPKGIQGRDAVDFVEKALGDKYDALLPRLTVRADQQWASDIGNLRQMVAQGSIDPKYAAAFDRILNNKVLGKFKGQQALTGQTVKDIESTLGAEARRLGQSADADARLLSDALSEVQSNLRDLVTRSNPQAAKELKTINTGWANFKRMQRAASSVGAEDGAFSAAQLQSAVKAMDKSKDKGAFSRGNALMQDLSDPAKSILGPKVPDSGTAERAFTLGMLLNPKVYAGALASPLIYSQTGQNALATALARRPQGAQAVGGMLDDTLSRFGLPAAQVGVNLLR